MDVQSLKYISLLMEIKVDSFDEMLAFLKQEHPQVEKNSIYSNYINTKLNNKI